MTAPRRLPSVLSTPDITSASGATGSTPVLVGDLYLDARLPDLNTEGRYRAARLLTWLHGRPIGEVSLPLDQGPVTSGRLAALVWPLVADRVTAHCQDDGIPAPDHLPAGGLARDERPACRKRGRAADDVTITVVIATRDRTESLLRCLTVLSKSSYSAFDVVVVDSAPRSDSTERALAEHPGWPFPLRYVHEPRPGLALAHNAALPAVTGDVVAITDDDVEVDRDWLASIAEAFTESDATCVTGLIVPAELETRAQVLVEESGGFGRGFTRRVYTRDMPEPGPLFPFTAGRFGSGANMAFRTDWLKARSGFDAAMGAGTPARGGDDLTAFLQVIIDGGTLVYEPRAVVRHWHRREYEGMRRQAFHYGMGLGAYLAASVSARPALLGAMLLRVVPAVRHLLSPGSAKNVGRGANFPRELVWRERAGVLAGPFGYAVSRWRYRGYVPGRTGGAA
jgi:glycosyltransferase involved in cell wall biosynthesis